MDKFRDKIFCGDSFNILKSLPSGFVDCIITSPPYWALRDYGITPQVWDGDQQCKHEWDLKDRKDPMDRGGHGDHDNSRGIAGKWEMRSHQSGFCFKCGAWRGSLGLEPAFELFIKHLCDIFDQGKRVLKDEGTCWVNIGDTYGQNWRGGKEQNEWHKQKRSKGELPFMGCKKWDRSGMPDKCLCMIPFRFAIEMVNRGWLLRNTIIWLKPNCMPSSVKDRFTVDFEYIFLFAKSKKYYFEPQFEDSKTQYKKFNVRVRDYTRKKTQCPQFKATPFEIAQYHGRNIEYGNQRNKRSVWKIATKPYKEAHFATYPPELCEIPINAGCPQFICNNCGKPRYKVWNVRYVPYKTSAKSQIKTDLEGTGDLIQGNIRPQQMKYGRADKISTPVGYTDCGCNAGFSSGIVLDPFCGSGTSLYVAKKLNRDYLGIDLSPKYIEMAIKRIQSITNADKNQKE